MLARLLRLIAPNREPVVAAGIPGELLTAISLATVTMREAADPKEGARLVVKVSGLGSWYWEGVKHCAARIMDRYAISECDANKAARLVAAAIAARNATQGQKPRRRRGWVHNWSYDNE